MRASKGVILAAAVIILPMLTAACAPKPFLIVNYQLPAASDTLSGQQTALVISDYRENKSFLTGNAKPSLIQFNETYSLVVLQEDGSGDLLGVYEFEALLEEIFKQRLNNAGIQVSPAAVQPVYELEIRLEEFKLDLFQRKWIINMNYQANLFKNGRLLAMESINGSAERLKVMAKSDAEKVLGELLTDMVNRLDLTKLFQQDRR